MIDVWIDGVNRESIVFLFVIRIWCCIAMCEFIFFHSDKNFLSFKCNIRSIFNNKLLRYSLIKIRCMGKYKNFSFIRLISPTLYGMLGRNSDKR